MNKVFEPTPGNKWEINEKMPGYKEYHVYLGPCPACGSRTFNYGGGWRCLAHYCIKNANNPASSVGEAPIWWEEDINVFKDGDSWCATYTDFINLQESNAGFGDTPQEAVDNLKSFKP